MPPFLTMDRSPECGGADHGLSISTSMERPWSAGAFCSPWSYQTAKFHASPRDAGTLCTVRLRLEKRVQGCYSPG